MTASTALRRLARLYGMQPDYYDVAGVLRSAGEKTLLPVLRILGCPIESADEADELVNRRRRELWNRVVPPVTVAWEGAGTLRLRLPAENADGEFRVTVTSREDGRERTTEGSLAEWPTLREKNVAGQAYVVKAVDLPGPLPHGYHDVSVSVGADSHELLGIAAPRRAYVDERLAEGRSWGVFLPLHALHRESSWGAGSVSDLEALVDFVSELGGNLVATLPMLGAELEFGDDPSPYSPSSRLVWNELFADVARMPGFADDEEVRRIVEGDEFQKELAELRQRAYVDYDRQTRLQRTVIERLSDAFFEADRSERADLDAFAGKHPEAVAYARYKAVRQRLGQHWSQWPERLRDGTLESGDYDERVFRSFLFAQWQTQRQLKGLADEARSERSLWYLDFTLGVAGGGFDVWRHRDAFGLGASGGAPPDAFFTLGQDWGFPPLHPAALREQGYGYFVEGLRHHLEFGRLLRFDHVMGLHRLYWVPHGLDARDGVYVRYHAEEFFAILCLESHRYGATIVGENLGTVPAAVNRLMNEHGILDMYVLQYETGGDPERPLRPPPASSVASLNTHDMPTFTSFWTGLDIDDRVDLGLMDEDEAKAERERRADLRRLLGTWLAERNLVDQNTFDPRDALDGLHAWLAMSDAACVLLNLEDLWLETRPQNVPGTFLERPNWRRRTRLSFEEFTTLETVRAALRDVARRRRHRTGRETP